MDKLERALSLEQILEGMRQLSDQEKRTLASMILSDPKLEAFVDRSVPPGRIDHCFSAVY